MKSFQIILHFITARYNDQIDLQIQYLKNQWILISLENNQDNDTLFTVNA